MPAAFAHERLLAELAVQRASILTKRVLSTIARASSASSSTGSFSKPDSTPVTIADFAAQALLISAIHAAFPLDSFVGEENADALRTGTPALQEAVWSLVSSTHLDDPEAEALLKSPENLEELFRVIDLGGSGVGGKEGRVWMLDPIDGTATYLKGEQYAVSLALVEDGREVVGVVGCPNLSLRTGRVEEKSVDEEGMGFMLSAVRGEGAVMRPMGMGGLRPAERVERSVEGPKDLSDLHFVDYTLSEVSATEQVKRVAARLGAVFPWTEIWSSHMRYVSLIVGDGDVQVRIPANKKRAFYVWDHAGTQLIFTEIGGKITDLEGREIEFGTGRQLSSNWGLVAAKEDVHARILQVVKEILKEESQ